MIRKLGALGMALGLGLGLADCAKLTADYQAITGATVSARAINIAVNAAHAVEITATKYKNLPLCSTGQTFLANGCSTQAIIDQITPLVSAMVAAKNVLLNDGLAATPGDLSALSAAKDTALAALASNGVSL